MQQKVLLGYVSLRTSTSLHVSHLHSRGHIMLWGT